MTLDEISMFDGAPFPKQKTESVKPKSNADRIRQMTDEELAKFMCLVKDKLCFGCAYSHVDECEGIPCEEARKQWLKQEVSEDAAD